MKTSSEWLAQYVDVPWSPERMARELTMAGLEVEGIDVLGNTPDGVVVGHIISRKPHPNADRLSVCMVKSGAGEAVQVVCGAPNCDAGRKAAFATVGTTMSPDFTIKKAKLRGVESFGMLCSARELGLSDDHDGIMLLPDDAPLGTPLRDYLGTDTVVDWEVTPNRPDWLSHIGIAREIAALTGNPLTMPELTTPVLGSGAVGERVSVRIDDPDLCPRYTARLVENVRIGPSPDWMQRRLRAVGLRPINNVVDITNFVLMECGQPLHAFDFDSLAEHAVVVRRAREGETLVTLDGTAHTLGPDSLLIADPVKGVALAGVMGGANSEIGDETTTVLIESAAFDPASIRATARRLGLHSDSSYRFARGVNLEMVAFASARAADLVARYAGGTVVDGLVDVYPGATGRPEIRCRFGRVNKVLGVEIAPERIVEIFGGLGLEIRCRGELECLVRVPPHRLDLTREIDLIEEVARVHGVNNIPLNPERMTLGGARQDDALYRKQGLREQLLGLGLTECVNYSMISARDASKCTGFGESELVRIKNPLSAEFEIMRPTVQPGLLRNVAHNIAHGNSDLRLFELARVYCRRQDFSGERLQAAILLTGRRFPQRHSEERDLVYDLYDIKGVVEDLAAQLRIEDLAFARCDHPAFIPGAAVSVVSGGVEIATFGEVCDQLTGDMRLRHPLFLALVEVDRFGQVPVRPSEFSGLPQFPAAARDISFVADRALAHREVVDAIRRIAGKLLEQVELFDIYEDQQAVGPGRKSMAYSLTFRAPDRTLKDSDIDKTMTRLFKQLPSELGVELRDQ